jgi:hypothetical protein
VGFSGALPSLTVTQFVAHVLKVDGNDLELCGPGGIAGKDIEQFVGGRVKAKPGRDIQTCNLVVYERHR